MEVYAAWANMEAHVTSSVDLQVWHISRAHTHNFLSRRHLTASRGDPSLDLMAGHLVLVCAVIRSSLRLLLLVDLFFFRSWVNPAVLDVQTSSKALPRSSLTLDHPDFLGVLVQVLLGCVLARTSLSSSSLDPGALGTSGALSAILGRRIPVLMSWSLSGCTSKYAALFHSILGRLILALASSWFFVGSTGALPLHPETTSFPRTS